MRSSIKADSEKVQSEFVAEISDCVYGRKDSGIWADDFLKAVPPCFDHDRTSRIAQLPFCFLRQRNGCDSHHGAGERWFP